ncbi:putative peptide methionine sulfoxide reductase [Erysiphe necator]|nr:putative peptide methionine sulfoxide reductase [Erysiphe necator]
MCSLTRKLLVGSRFNGYIPVFAMSMMESNISKQLICPIKNTQNVVTAPRSSIASPEGAKKAIFAAGCFWSVEKYFRDEFTDKGLYDIRVGYIGGHTSNPTYATVCTGRTGFAEAILISFDPNILKYVQLVELFYAIHNPTKKNEQGFDIGTQYRSAIFYYDKEQEETARDVTERANRQWWSDEIVTEILPAGEWWDAEDYHQQYFVKNPDTKYQCTSHYYRYRNSKLK